MKDALADVIRQWLLKAREDWDAVQILSRDENCPRAVVCFHCQQYVEKMLKALLTLREIEFPKTHALDQLAELAFPVAPEIAEMCDEAETLVEYAVRGRYPFDPSGIEPSRMREVIALAERFAAILLPKFPTGL